MNGKLLVCLFILIGFGLRVMRLSFQPLWGDEGWSFYFATLPWPDMLAKTAADIHPPLYYALLHLWLQGAGGGPEVARFLSVGWGTLLIPVGYCLGRWLEKDRQPGPIGLAVAGVISVAPMAIYYSQEVRMYGLVTLLGAVSTLLFVRLLDGRRGAFWPYSLITTFILYTHYYGLFIPACHGWVWLIRYRRIPKQPRTDLLKAMIGAGLLFLPWVIYSWSQLAHYVENKVTVEGYHSLGLGEFLNSYLTTFSLGHLSDRLQPLHWGALGFVLLAFGGGVALWRSRSGGWYLIPLYLLVPLICGWLVNLISPFTPRYFERTLLIAAPAWWVLVAVGLVRLGRKQVLLGGLVASLLLGANIVNLLDFYGLPRYPEADYRPLLATVSAIAGEDDVLLASFQWQLGYYHAYLPDPHPQLVSVPGWGQIWGRDPARMAADLEILLAHTVWFPAHQTLGRAWEIEAEAILAQQGYPALQTWYNTTTKLSVIGGRAEIQPGPSVNFGNLLQAQINMPTSTEFEAGRGIIPVEITWRKLANLGSEHRVTLKLVDAAGEIWATRDSLPRAAQTSFTDLSVGESLIDHHGLLIPAGTPPGRYQLLLGVTNQVTESPLDLIDAAGQPQGVDAPLMEIIVIPPTTPINPVALPVQTRHEAVFEGALKLVGYSLSSRQIRSGEGLVVNLFWQGLASDLPGLITFVQLQDEAGNALALTERPPTYPTHLWTNQTVLRDLHKLQLPATIPQGTYRLAAGVLQVDKSRLQTASGDQVILGEISVQTRPHDFTPPQPQVTLAADFSGKAKLIGYDLDHPQDLKPGDTLNLTLYWQGQAEFERNWTVFAHLVDAEDKIWGQRDQIPGDGEFPTTSWVPDEYIVDTRQITLNADVPPGVYSLRVGFYDAHSPDFERLSVANGDSVILETSLTVSTVSKEE